MVVLGLVGGAVVVTAVVVSRRRLAPVAAGVPEWAPLRLVDPASPPSLERPRLVPVDSPPPPAPDAPRPPDVPLWVAPDSAGNCPESHPIKANKARRIYHLPGGRYYDATHATRCFCDADAAEADGYRAAKR
jgi:hypothetical protein